MNFLTNSYLSREHIYDPLDELLYVTTLDDKFLPTTGLLHSFNTVVLDVAPQIRYILRHEHERKKFKPEQMLLEPLWTNTRKTRRQMKEEQEGRKRWFEDKVDPESVLKTWVDIPCTESTGDTEDISQKS